MGGTRKSWLRKASGSLLRDRRGVALIEMAMALPVLVLLLFGIISYGSWIALANVVQQSANEAARAAIAGLTSSERAALAQQAAQTALTRSYDIPASRVAVAVADDGNSVAVTVAYDATGNALLTMPIIPKPPSRIARTAAVRVNPL
ncbi:MAG TPA: TadE/TadG family type IV pilus assembly protein [Sphingomonas sp.]|nr:TadE/TadG family type IV pilus assembly protein [Sphingomonas sp.]